MKREQYLRVYEYEHGLRECMRVCIHMYTYVCVWEDRASASERTQVECACVCTCTHAYAHTPSNVVDGHRLGGGCEERVCRFFVDQTVEQGACECKCVCVTLRVYGTLTHE